MGTNLAILRLPVSKAAILLLLTLLAAMTASGSFFGGHDLIAAAATIDLIVTVPAVYWLFIRRTSIPVITVVPVFLSGVIIGSAVTPDDQRWLLDKAIFYAVPFVELLVLGYVGFRAFRIRRAYRLADPQMDVIEKMRAAFSKFIKPLPVARAAAFEVGVFALVFFKWRRSSDGDLFTYHKRSGAMAVLSIFLFLIVAETVVLHYLLSLWSVTAAWIATGLSAYFSFQVVGQIKGVILRPVVIGRKELRIRGGILADSIIPFEVVESVAVAGNDQFSPDASVFTPLGGLSAPNVRITLSEPVIAHGVYGITRQTDEIGVFVDEPERFVSSVASLIKI